MKFNEITVECTDAFTSQRKDFKTPSSKRGEGDKFFYCSGK